MLDRETRRKLAQLNKDRDTSKPAGDALPIPETKVLTLEDVLPGRVHEREDGNLYICEQPTDHFQPDTAEELLRSLSSLERERIAPEKTLFLDIETCGLANCPLFLIGTLRATNEGMQVRQFFARDYSEEAPLLTHIHEELGNSKALVTFNGITFDMPYIRDRMIFHRLSYDSHPRHLDLLQRARTKWRGKLPNCRLQTLEEHILGRRRFDDTPGHLIPEIYHEFVRSGNAAPLEGVFFHNALDLIAMVELLPHLLSRA